MNTSTSTKLVEFPCGRFDYTEKDDGSFDVNPLPDKGTLCFQRTAEGKLEYIWTPSASGSSPTKDLVPQGAIFKKIDTGKSGDRVYILHENASKFRKFFWLQTSDKNKDEEYVSKVLECLKDPAGVAPMVSISGSSAADPNNLMHQLLASFSQGDAGTNNTGAAAATATPAPTTAPTPNAPVRTTAQGAAIPTSSSTFGAGAATPVPANNPANIDFSSLLQTPAAASGASATGTGSSNLTQEDIQRALNRYVVISVQHLVHVFIKIVALCQSVTQTMRQQQSVRTNLVEIVSTEDVLPILSDKEVQEELIKLLPEGLQTTEELFNTISSPQFRQVSTVQ
uniref:Pru domain-containing protein n=1 Tax=Aplanochytrium stocchinoi TaxID=215587 RepID=A0A7S3LNJ7_9STRA